MNSEVDSGNVVRLRPGVTHRCCPDCGYLMSQLEIDQLKVNLDCPRCGDRNINDFQPINMA